MTLVKAFRTGNVAGVDGLPEQEIETYLSHVFLIDSFAYKVYKSAGMDLYGVLNNPAERAAFYQEDFAFNTIISPEVYIALQPVERSQAAWSLTTPELATDYYIQMRRLDPAQDLTNLLVRDEITPEELFTLSQKIAKTFLSLSKEYASDYKTYYDLGLQALFLQRIDDITPLVPELNQLLKGITADSILDTFREVLTDEYFSTFRPEHLTIVFDLHSDNVIKENNQLEMIDGYLLQARWRVCDPFAYACLLAADCRAFGSDEAAAAVYDGFATVFPLQAKRYQYFYEAYNSYIRAWFLQHVGKTELASRHREVLLKQLAALSAG